MDSCKKIEPIVKLSFEIPPEGGGDDEIAKQRDRRRERLTQAVGEELDRAYEKHGTGQWGRHEFFAILKEEVDELWDAIKQDAPFDEVCLELRQVIAMCFRYYETGDRYEFDAKRFD